MQTDDQRRDPLGRIDTAKLYPPFLDLVNELLNRCYRQGYFYVATSGTRLWTEQDALYARGRTAEPLGREHIITHAKGGESPHNFEIALDFVRYLAPYEGKLVAQYMDYSDEAYVLLAQQARALGLESGYWWGNGFKDAQHIQLPVREAGLSWKHLADVHRHGGISAVFAELDTHTWGGK